MHRGTKEAVLRLVQQDKDFSKEFVREALQQVLDTNIHEALAATQDSRPARRARRPVERDVDLLNAVEDRRAHGARDPTR